MKEFVVDVPQYAILSHRWSDDEITFKEFKKNINTSSAGYKKVRRLCECVQAYNDIYLDGALPVAHWIWIYTGQYMATARPASV